MSANAIVRGTTPVIKFNFGTINPADIETAYLTLKQLGTTLVKLDITDATVEAKAISWRLTQEQSLTLVVGRETTIVCDWRLFDGVRGRSKVAICSTEDPGVNEVI